MASTSWRRARWTGRGRRYPDSARLQSLERVAYLKLMEKYQEFSPFKFIIYSEKGGLDVPQLAPAPAAAAIEKPQ